MSASFTHLISVTNSHDIPGNKTLVFEVERVLKDHASIFLSTEKDERVKMTYRGHGFLTCLSSAVEQRAQNKELGDITENPSKTKEMRAYLRTSFQKKESSGRFLHPFFALSPSPSHTQPAPAPCCGVANHCLPISSSAPAWQDGEMRREHRALAVDTEATQDAVQTMPQESGRIPAD